MRKFEMIYDSFASGWSFFFRWPVTNAKVYRPWAIFLGPCLQVFVFLTFSMMSALVLGKEHQAWSPFLGWIGLSMLTGFFHEDGLADTADSLGVSKFGTAESLEKIHSTFKDPRLGTFGVSALVIFWLFRYTTAAQGVLDIIPAAFICLFARAFSLGFGLYLYPRVRAAALVRSSHVMQQVNGRIGFLVLLFSVLVGLLLCVFSAMLCKAYELSSIDPLFSIEQFMNVLLATVVSIALSGFVLHRLVQRTEAVNGDLLGASVCISEVFLTICFLRFF